MIFTKWTRKSSALVFFLVAIAQISEAKVYMNSMCYLENKRGERIQGSSINEKFELASVSKVVTSYWATAKLGAKYRFATTLTIEAVGSDVFDVHINGGKDPVFGRDMTHLMLSELALAGVHKIRNLTFDENFYYFYSVQSKSTWSLFPSKSEIAASLRAHLKYTPEYFTTKRIATAKGLKMADRPLMSVQNAYYVPSSEYKKDNRSKNIVLVSAPLYELLKFMNRVSNNFVADHLFLGLGGADAFQSFIRLRLGLNSEDIKFVNGSGDSVIKHDPTNHTYKEYNEASCDSLIRVIMGLRNELQDANLDLEDVMAVSGRDASTLGGRYSGEFTSDAVIAKTGSVNPAITLAGMLSTERGEVYFAVMYHTDGPAEWSSARNQIRKKIYDLINKFGGKDSLDYTPTVFLPFDQISVSLNHKQLNRG